MPVGHAFHQNTSIFVPRACAHALSRRVYVYRREMRMREREREREGGGREKDGKERAMARPVENDNDPRLGTIQGNKHVSDFAYEYAPATSRLEREREREREREGGRKREGRYTAYARDNAREGAPTVGEYSTSQLERNA